VRGRLEGAYGVPPGPCALPGAGLSSDSRVVSGSDGRRHKKLHANAARALSGGIEARSSDPPNYGLQLEATGRVNGGLARCGRHPPVEDDPRITLAQYADWRLGLVRMTPSPGRWRRTTAC
jgi:hypothetical protein